MMKVLVLVLPLVLAAVAVKPPSIGTEDNAPVEWITEYYPEHITTESGELNNANVDSLSRDGSTFQTVESTSQFEWVTSTDSPEFENFSVTSIPHNLKMFAEHVTQNKGIDGVQISDLNRSGKMMNDFNESESNTPRAVTTSGSINELVVVNEGDISLNSTSNEDFDPDNNTGTTDIADESAALQFRQFTKEGINNSKEFQVMNEGNNLNPMLGKPYQGRNDFIRKKLTEMNLNKCICPPYHFLENSSKKCVATQPSSVEVLTNPITGGNYSIPEANFRQIQVINLTCPHPLWLHKSEYDLLLTGEARHFHYDTIIKSSQFCMENIDFSDGHREWYIKACLEPPRIPKCCANNQYYDVAMMACVGADSSRGSPLDGSEPTHPRLTIPVEENSKFPTMPAEPQASTGPPSCSGGRKLVAVPVGNILQNSVSLENYLNDVRLYVTHSDFKVYKHLGNTEYCVDWSTKPGDEVDYVAVFCYEDPFKIHHSQCSLSKNCIRKCCPGDEIIDMIYLNCTAPHERPYLFKPRFYQHSWAEDTGPVLRNTSYEVVHGFPLCSYVDAKHNEDFYLLDDGAAYFPEDNLRLTSEHYCVDAQQGYLHQTDGVIFYCVEAGTPYGNNCWRLRLVVYPVLQGVSCVFLLVTLLVYQLLPELQRLTISGRSLPSHVLALLVASCCMLAIFVGQLSETNMALCITMAFIAQFSLLATFFWLNVMCFEMWYRIRIQPTLAVSQAESRQKYMLYSLYGWGLPALITLITGVVQAVVTSSPLTPNFGNPYCWFKPNEHAYWIYFSGFVILLCNANIFFFVDLAQITVKQCLGSNLIHHSTQQHMGRILLCLKLFIVMGVTWVFEEISYHDDACARWFAVDIMNLLRGPFVFLSVVSTRSVLVKLKNKVMSLCDCVGGGVRPLFVPPSTRGWAVANPKRKAASLHLDSIRRYPTCRMPSDSGSRDSLASVKTEETSIGPKSETSINPKAEDSSSVYQRESSVVTEDSECSSGHESSEGQLQLDPAAEEPYPVTQDQYSAAQESYPEEHDQYSAAHESYPEAQELYPVAQESYPVAQESYEGSRQQGESRQSPELVAGPQGEVGISPSQNVARRDEMMLSVDEDRQSQDDVVGSHDGSKGRSNNLSLTVSSTPSRSAESPGGLGDNNGS